MVNALLIIVVALALVGCVLAAVNDEIVRNIDASSSIVTVTLSVKASGLEGGYNLMFPDATAARLAFLEVTDKDKNVYTVRAPQTDGVNSHFVVETGAQESATLKVKAVFTELLEMYPAKITQLEEQRVRLTDNHYVLSPYHTVSQKTTVKLASSAVESYTRLEPNSKKGERIVYGPYKEIPAMSMAPMVIHSVNNKPFAKLTRAEREIEVSHWGNIAVEETYELRNVGANLDGGFSRLDYQMQRSTDSPSFAGLTAFLPKEARDIYYRDQIGNISTSDITANEDDLQMDVNTRFPLFGGWKTEFYIGYNVPASLALFVDENDRYSLHFDYFTIFQDVWVEGMEIKVVLPEGCTDIDVKLPYDVTEMVDTKRFTYLDSKLNGGRPVVTIRAKNVVENHSEQVVISYNFEKSRMLVEPFMLVGFFFAIFLVMTVANAASDNKDTKKKD
jgi:oligosaccharyltransferase complex subunit alpha (ribophorin I)